ncbi:MAG: transposase family protein [Bacteroidales bacterium]|jgi:putative transposase|nr:transposase family protein [Bacteroidales bacterium]
MIIYPSEYFRNWYYVGKHTSKLRNRAAVEYRINVLEFWNKHGLDAALEYARDLNPHHKCSRATLYRWRKALTESGKQDKAGRCRLSAIDPKSTCPIHCRLPKNYSELYEPIRQLLGKHNTLGKNKIYHMLKNMVKNGKLILNKLEQIPSISTIGRIIKAMRGLGRLPNKQKLTLNGANGKLYVVVKKRKKKLRRDGYIPKEPGDLVQMDGVITYCYGKRVYILNAIDYVSAKAISIILPSNKSHQTAKVLEQIDELFGFYIKNVQTDNGSEFMGSFADEMQRLGKTHFYNYIKRPMWNGKVERFNRTLQEEWLADPDIQVLLSNNKNEANEELQKYLDWYNNERPHQSINYMTPTEYMVYFNTGGDLKKSQMS